MHGSHLRYGPLAPPIGRQLSLTGVTHFHVVGRIVDEWVVYDQLSMLVQIKLAGLNRAAQAG